MIRFLDPLSTFSARTACNMYFTQNELEKERRDGKRHMFVAMIALGTFFELSYLWNTFYQGNRFATRALTLFSYGNIASFGMLLACKKIGIDEPLRKILNQMPHLVKLAIITSGVALCMLKQPIAGTVLLASEVLHLLQASQMLPLAVHQTLDFIRTPLIILGMLTRPVQGIKDGMLLMMDTIFLCDLFNAFLQSMGLGFKDHDFFLPVPKEVETQKIQDFARDYVENQGIEHLNPSHTSYDIKNKRYAFWFDQESVHRLPTLLEANFTDGLENAAPQQLIDLVDEKAKKNQVLLGAGFDRLKVAFIQQKFPDVVPVHVDVVLRYIHLTIRALLQKEGIEFVDALSNLEAIGLACVDGWVGELKEHVATKPLNLLDEIHAKFGERRSSWLDEQIRQFVMLIEKNFNLGGANNVHYNQRAHLIFRSMLRTTNGETALLSSSNTARLFNALKFPLIRMFVFGHIQYAFNQLGVQFWRNELKQLFELQGVSVDQGAPKPYYPISPKLFWEWVGQRGKMYGFTDEDGAPNPLFFQVGDNQGHQQINLTQVGMHILLADAGVFTLNVHNK